MEYRQGKEKLSISTDGVSYIRHPGNSTRKPLGTMETMHTFSCLAGYIVNRTSQQLFYTATASIEKEVMDTLQFLTVSAKRKGLGIDLTKEQRDPHGEDSFLRHQKWRGAPCSWIGRIDIVNTMILPKAIYRSSPFPIKITISFITEIEKTTPKFLWNHKRLQIDKRTEAMQKELPFQVSRYISEPQ